MIYKIISQTDPVAITTKKGQSQKTTLVLQELGGRKLTDDNGNVRYERAHVCTLFGNQVKFYPNELVAANFTSTAREYNGSWYDDNTINEIYKLTNNEPF